VIKYLIVALLFVLLWINGCDNDHYLMIDNPDPVDNPEHIYDASEKPVLRLYLGVSSEEDYKEYVIKYFPEKV